MKGFKGSTLLLALLVAGFITIVGLAVSRLAVTETRMSSSVTDSSAAYYAAEACLEDSLWQWRNNRNVEVNLTTKNLDNNIGCQEKIWYKTAGSVGDFDHFPQSSKTLTKDESWEMRVDGLSSITIKYQITKDYLQTTNPDHGVEIGLYNPASNAWETLFYDQNRDAEAQTTGITVSLTNVSLVRIKPWDADIQFAIKGPSGQLIDSGTHYIEATGYTSKVKRKLTAEIDRQSGTLTNLYDFVIYASGTLSQQ